MAVKGTDGFINEIVERSNGRKYKLGDFEIRNDFGVNAYYKGEGGDVVIPEELDGKATLWVGHAKNITSLCYPGSFKTVEHPNEFDSKNTVQKLIFDEGVEEIRPNMGNTCFTGFKKLTDVVLPSTLKYLGKNAFKNSPWYEEHLETVDGCCYLGSFLVDSDKEIE